MQDYQTRAGCLKTKTDFFYIFMIPKIVLGKMNWKFHNSLHLISGMSVFNYVSEQ